ncbi:MAG: hypothetical protein Q8Q33_06255 [Chlamydiota bacterium]|nr:hypothetical protein [Chlamydiota bacterium]
MHKRLPIMRLIFVLLLIMESASDGFSKDLPDAPNGYTWNQADNIQAYFLIPEGWYYMEEQKQDTKAVFITKEKIEQGNDFRTGLSVNVIQQSNKKTGLAPSKTAKNFIDNMQSLTERSEIEAYNHDSFSGFKGLFKSGNLSSEPIVLFCLAMGNDDTGTLYIILFESPQPEWEENWKIGSIILDNIALETGF